MNLPFQNQFERMGHWPLAGKLAAAAVAVIVGWWICSDTVWAWAGRYSANAAELRALLDRGQQQTGGRLESARDSVIAHGHVQMPRRSDVGAAMLAQAAARIIPQGFKYETRSPTKLPGSALRDVIGSGQSAQRVTAAVQFDAAPEVVTRVISELESSPEIDSISSLTIQRMDAAKKLRVKLVLESWVIGSDLGGRGMT